MSNTQLTSSLMEEVAKKKDVEGKKVQFFFQGKEMDHEYPLGAYLSSDGVVIVFVRNPPPS